MRVYRYMNAEYALLALQKKRWKIARILDLNDPLDCRPTLAESPPQLSDFAHADFERQYFSKVYEDVGIICYSIPISDPVVWSHYADAHRGIALGFDFPAQEEPTRVEYSDSDFRAQLDYRLLESMRQKGSSEDLMEVISQGFTKKASSWAYEQEYRHFIHFDGCVMEGSHYFRDFPVAHLGEVVLGVRCKVPAADVRRIVSVWPKGRSVAISKATVSRRSYTLQVVPAHHLLTGESFA